jgi:aminopeptidase N
MTNKAVKRRSDYTVPDFFIEQTTLSFELDPEATLVKSLLHIKRNGSHHRPLVLDGEQLQLITVLVDGKVHSNYQQSDSTLLIDEVGNDFTIAITCRINPAANSSLEGLYVSDGAFCTQCEAEGFRKITYFLDRPDVLSSYTVTITAAKCDYPFLLSNGNEIDRGEGTDGTHWVTWCDPHKKPCYLFALVAGDFDRLSDVFNTRSGRQVKLELYVDTGKLDRGQHALDSLKRAMRWDEDVFDLEYDLDVYMIVAVDFFNMGAMENKGLNVFNSKFVLANTQTATDDDFFNIESVIAHEYFHNWTGNRVTCRDWFQLSLKEGLTVFRDQLFSETFHSKLATRIKQVKVMREHQFAEDAGPMSHPIRPNEVMEMNNFYTVTVYDKGAEVIRMLWTLLGAAGFKKGMKLYFEQFDGQAVTCDDFVNVMQRANNLDLGLFKRWYKQSGTPVITVTQDPAQPNKVTFSQHTPPTVDQANKQALYIPLQIESIANDSKQSSELSQIQLTSGHKDVSFSTGTAALIVNSGFSAPVKVKQTQTEQQLAMILLSASNKFDRWSASQSLYSDAITDEMLVRSQADSNSAIAGIFRGFVENINGDFELLGEALLPPTLESIIANQSSVDLDRLAPAYKKICKAVATEIAPILLTLVKQLISAQPYSYDQESIIRRRCLSTVLKVLASAKQGQESIQAVFETSDNMTDTLTALHAAQYEHLDLFDSLMSQFEQKWHADGLVLDKWFALHATTDRADILPRLASLMQHDQFSFKNPNRTRAILGSFAFYNTLHVHAIDGSGYRFLIQHLLNIDQVNPQVAARIITPLLSWRKFDQTRQSQIQIQLAHLLDSQSLSNDLYEKVSKTLGN